MFYMLSCRWCSYAHTWSHWIQASVSPAATNNFQEILTTAIFPARPNIGISWIRVSVSIIESRSGMMFLATIDYFKFDSDCRQCESLFWRGRPYLQRLDSVNRNQRCTSRVFWTRWAWTRLNQPQDLTCVVTYWFSDSTCRPFALKFCHTWTVQTSFLPCTCSVAYFLPFRTSRIYGDI